MNLEFQNNNTLWESLSKKEKRYIFQLSIIFFSQIVDVITTTIALDVGASEGNPLMRAIIDQGGVELFSTIKIFTIIGLIAIIELLRRIFDEQKLSDWYIEIISKTSSATNIFMTLIMLNNLAIIQRHM